MRVKGINLDGNGSYFISKLPIFEGLVTILKDKFIEASQSIEIPRMGAQFFIKSIKNN